MNGLASANLHTGRYEGMGPQSYVAFSLEEAPTFGWGSSPRLIFHQGPTLYQGMWVLDIHF
jgi:hypothetical protein